MKKHCFLLFVALIALVAVSGCSGGGGGNVGLVKNGVLEFDQTLTVGQALDGYKYFKSTTWRGDEDEQGRQFVEFRGWQIHSNPNWTCKGEVIVQFLISVDGKTFEIGYTGWKDDEGAQESTQLSSDVMIDSIYNNNPLGLGWIASCKEKEVWEAKKKKEEKKKAAIANKERLAKEAEGRAWQRKAKRLEELKMERYDWFMKVRGSRGLGSYTIREIDGVSYWVHWDGKTKKEYDGEWEKMKGLPYPYFGPEREKLGF